ncbi:DUF4411 family protein [Sphingobacterium sp. lm-10]|uniref:DUF4411 family protein n=1 Tax=Sphingobacterium sp. lm-10 TaxID=2944904 RepID=UPI00201FD785|nr:DUF4411 family protein [Sphingobacterium sp. lm-10]MCL7989213.1 DUF4411 family protein [Sphingobacterium sp. lm-10]
MTVVIDTNSLVSLVRYYLPFDVQDVLFAFIKQKIADGEIVIIDKVLEQCSYQSKGLVLNSLKYLTDKAFLKAAQVPTKTDEILPPSPAKFLRQVDNQFVNRVVRNRREITDAEYDVQKNHYLNDADMKMIIFCLHLKQKTSDRKILLVTEETEQSNDNKLFKKIPAICKELQIETCPLPDLLNLYKNEVKLEFK